MNINRNWDHTPTWFEWSEMLISLWHYDYYDLMLYKHAHGVYNACTSQWLSELPKARQRAAWEQITARMTGSYLGA